MPIPDKQYAFPVEHAWAALVDSRHATFVPPKYYDWATVNVKAMEALAYDQQSDLYTSLFDDSTATDQYEYRRWSLANGIKFNKARTWFKSLNLLATGAQFAYDYEYVVQNSIKTQIHMIASPPRFGSGNPQYLDFVSTRLHDCVPYWIGSRVTFANTFNETVYIGRKGRAVALYTNFI